MNIDTNVRKILVALLRRWRLIVVFAIIGGLLGYVYTANFTQLTYTSTVEFLAYAVDSQQELNDSSTSSSAANGDSMRISYTSKMNYAMKMIDTYIEIFKTNKFCGKVAGEMNKKYYTNLSPADIKHSFTIETVENTAMFKLIVTTTDPTLSYNIAHQMEESVPEQMEETNSGLVQTTVEDKAIKPNTAEGRGYLKKCLLGAVAGLLIAAAYVILRDLLDVRIKSAEELSQRYDVPVLGSIPAFTTGKRNPAGNKQNAKKGAK